MAGGLADALLRVGLPAFTRVLHVLLVERSGSMDSPEPLEMLLQPLP